MDYEKDFERSSEKYWNSLSYDQQLATFCAVVRRIYRGEIVEKGTYRHVLYDTFKFGMEAYSLALYDGYLEIHNAIFNSQHYEQALVNILENPSDAQEIATKALQ